MAGLRDWPSLQTVQLRHRRNLRGSLGLVPSGGYLRLTRDALFESPSQAAAVMIGHSANGPDHQSQQLLLPRGEPGHRVMSPLGIQVGLVQMRAHQREHRLVTLGGIRPGPAAQVQPRVPPGPGGPRRRSGQAQHEMVLQPQQPVAFWRLGDGELRFADEQRPRKRAGLIVAATLTGPLGAGERAVASPAASLPAGKSAAPCLRLPPGLPIRLTQI
jgi:hypothetical protein